MSVKEPKKDDSDLRRCKQYSTEVALENAALYALGVMPPDESREFEAHLATGCSFCDEELRANQGTLGEVGETVAESAPGPSPGLRDRLVSRVSQAAQAHPPEGSEEFQVWKPWSDAPGKACSPGVFIVRGGEGDWQPTVHPGVAVKRLAVDPERDYITMLVRMEPGSSYPSHRHAGAEECFVLEGDLKVGDQTLRSGDYQCARSGSEHTVQSTENGCLLFIISSQNDELL